MQIDELNAAPSADRLTAFREAVVTRNGRWPSEVDFPTAAPHPIEYEASLCGITALATDPEELAANWMAAAQRTVDAQKEAA